MGYKTGFNKMQFVKGLFGGVLAKNISKMFSLQVANYLFPLLTLPYLSRVLGPDGFGKMGFAMALVGYFSIVVDYGFNLSATQAIVEHRHDFYQRSLTFWTVMICKAALFFAASLVFVVMMLSSGWSSDKIILWRPSLPF